MAENNKNDKDTTRQLLIESFKEIMLEVSFEDITIKKITNRAGLIRPTFYNHFSDKYAVLKVYWMTNFSRLCIHLLN